MIIRSRACRRAWLPRLTAEVSSAGPRAVPLPLLPSLPPAASRRFSGQGRPLPIPTSARARQAMQRVQAALAEATGEADILAAQADAARTLTGVRLAAIATVPPAVCASVALPIAMATPTRGAAVAQAAGHAIAHRSAAGTGAPVSTRPPAATALRAAAATGVSASAVIRLP